MSKRAISHILRGITALVFVAILLIARRSSAAPEAHILRIDPRAGVTDGQPVLTSVIELVQFNALSEVVTAKGCGAVRGDALLDCVSSAVEEKGALFKALPFPEGNTNLLVRVDAGENPAKFVSKTSWGAAGKDPLVGTAWLIALDASSAMGAALCGRARGREPVHRRARSERHREAHHLRRSPEHVHGGLAVGARRAEGLARQHPPDEQPHRALERRRAPVRRTGQGPHEGVRRSRQHRARP